MLNAKSIQRTRLRYLPTVPFTLVTTLAASPSNAKCLTLLFFVCHNRYKYARYALRLCDTICPSTPTVQNVGMYMQLRSLLLAICTYHFWPLT